MCCAEARPTRKDASAPGWRGRVQPFCLHTHPHPDKPRRQPWPRLNTWTETLTGPGQPHLSARTLLRAGCVSWRSKQPSSRSWSIQTSHGSVSEAGRAAESGARDPLRTVVALLVPLPPGPPASQRSHFPACRDSGQLVREGITHLHRVCGSQRRKAHFPPLPQPPLPPGTDFCLAETSWDLAESGSSRGFGTEGAGGALLSSRTLLRWPRGPCCQHSGVCTVHKPTLGLSLQGSTSVTEQGRQQLQADGNIQV